MDATVDDIQPDSAAMPGPSGSGSATATPTNTSTPTKHAVADQHAYATSNGSATAGVPPAGDYTTSSGTLTFAPGVTSRNASVPITNDTLQESSETITLTLSAPTNATLGAPNPATLTIIDDETPPAPSEEFYTYDQIGNMRSKTGVGAYSYGAQSALCPTGALNKPHAAVSAGAASYCYDQNGNMLSGAGRTNMQWDAENRPTSITNGGVTETYSYDADGERIGRTSGGTTTVYLGGVWEESNAGAVTTYYTFNAVVVALRNTNGVSYLHGDHLGSVSVASGAQPSQQRFGPWGTITSGGIAATSLNYTSQRLDSGTGLLYYHARYYDPVLARFISADMVVPGQTATSGAPNPQQLNRYSYVTNNPLTYNDPTGHVNEVGENPDAPMGAGGGGGGGGPVEPIAEPIAEPVVEPVVEPVEAAPPTTQMGPESAGEMNENGGVGAEPYGPYQKGTREDAKALLGFDPENSPATERYERPVPTKAENRTIHDAVKDQPCVYCGNIEEGGKQVPDHIDPLVVEHYRTGTIDRTRAFSREAVQPSCQQCSDNSGPRYSAFSRYMNKLLFGTKP